VTIIAGLFRYDGGTLDGQLCRAIRSAISRDAADPRTEFQTPLCYLVKIDIGAYGEAAFDRRGQTSAAALAGDPLLPPRYERTRTADLSRLHEGLLAADHAVLQSAHGSFCSAHYWDSPAKLSLVVDKLGLRPLYCWHEPGLVAFASALRILEATVELRKSLDTGGLCEQLSFGYPLGDHTAYRQIRCLCAGEVVTFDQEGERRLRYWRWDRRPNGDLDPKDAHAVVRDAIQRAIARRLKPREASVAAFLSGGLDSRLIATGLKDSVDHLHTFTFGDERLLDCYLAREYANRIGAQHHAYPSIDDNIHPSRAYRNSCAQMDQIRSSDLDRPQIVWSGDGGSVCLGCVYLDRVVVDRLRQGLEKQAIEQFIRINRRALGTRRILGDLFDDIPGDFVEKAVENELSRLDCRDPGVKAYVFLLINDQRRHLADHFEHIDLHKTELHLPMFDSEIVEAMLNISIDRALYHRFYYEMLDHFPDVVSSVPWQAYPGHLPCPLPLPQGLFDQWQCQKDVRKKRARARVMEIRPVLREKGIFGDILNRREIYLALWATRLGVSDRSYLLKSGITVWRHWKFCAESIKSDFVYMRANDRTLRRSGRSIRSIANVHTEAATTARRAKSGKGSM